MLRLYDHPLSQNSYKVRLALSFLKLEHELQTVDLAKGEQKQDWFLKLNPNGQVPTLVDGEYAIWESNAILLYLGRKYTSNNLIPQNLEELGQMLQWMMFEATKLSRYIGAARFLTRFMPPERVNPEELERTRKSAHQYLKVFNEYLMDKNWITKDFSIVDIACYGQIVTAPDGNLDLSLYPYLVSWMKRIEGLPGYIKLI